MDAKVAIKVAKDYVADVFKDEGLTQMGLEEVDYVEDKRAWDITVGFARPWDNADGTLLAAFSQNPRRTFKVVRIDDHSGKVISMKNRDVATVH